VAQGGSFKIWDEIENEEQSALDLALLIFGRRDLLFALKLYGRSPEGEGCHDLFKFMLPPHQAARYLVWGSFEGL